VKGSASDATPDAGEGVPLAQETVTLTGAGLSGWKSFETTNDLELSELTIVQDGVPPGVTSTSAQFVWLSL
jgi:hypothetical protein